MFKKIKSKVTSSFRGKKAKKKQGNKEESPCGNLHSRFTNSVEIQKNIYIVTAAIDFGTTYSGYAFSFQSNPDNIYVNKNWGENLGCVTNKAPTSVLTSATNGQDECFVAFGYEAEQRYVIQIIFKSILYLVFIIHCLYQAVLFTLS